MDGHSPLRFPISGTADHLEIHRVFAEARLPEGVSVAEWDLDLGAFVVIAGAGLQLLGEEPLHTGGRARPLPRTRFTGHRVIIDAGLPRLQGRPVAMRADLWVNGLLGVFLRRLWTAAAGADQERQRSKCCDGADS